MKAIDLKFITSCQATVTSYSNSLTTTGFNLTTTGITDMNTRNHATGLTSYIERQISLLKANGRQRTAETYRAALNSFRHFSRGRDIALCDISQDVAGDYQIWLRRRGVGDNTVSFYMRILRAVYNRAVDEGLADDCHPFRHVYTGIAKTVKRAVSLDTLRRIRRLDLSRRPALEYARDMFIMSFCLRGMSFVDMALLKNSDLCGGMLYYRRRKTGRMLSVAWTSEMQAIVDRHRGRESSEYLLPIIRGRYRDVRTAARNAGYNINRSLKRIAATLGIDTPLTMYVARHSWATLARNQGVPLTLISEGMGHSSEKTTRIYLASIDTTELDRANSRLIALL